MAVNSHEIREILKRLVQGLDWSLLYSRAGGFLDSVTLRSFQRAKEDLLNRVRMLAWSACAAKVPTSERRV